MYLKTTRARLIAALSFLFIVISFESQAQDVALKTNLLYDATATINAGVEVALAPKWSLDVSGNFNAWSFSDGKRWKHWLAQPELRYWLCREMGGHFLPSTSSAANTMWGMSTLTSSASSAPTSKISAISAIKDGMAAAKHRIWILMAAVKTLEHRGGDRCGLHLLPLRRVRVCRMRQEDRLRSTQQLRRPDKSRRQPDLRILNLPHP